MDLTVVIIIILSLAVAGLTAGIISLLLKLTGSARKEEQLAGLLDTLAVKDPPADRLEAFPQLKNTLKRIREDYKLVTDFSKEVKNIRTAGDFLDKADKSPVSDSLKTVQQWLSIHLTESFNFQKTEDLIKSHLELLSKSSDSLSSLASAAVSSIHRSTGAVYVHLYLKDSENKSDRPRLSLFSGHPYVDTQNRPVEIFFGEQIAGQCALEQAVVQAKSSGGYVGVNIQIAVPVKIGLRTVGVLETGLPAEPDVFTLRFLERIGVALGAFITQIQNEGLTEEKIKEAETLKTDLLQARNRQIETEEKLKVAHNELQAHLQTLNQRQNTLLQSFLYCEIDLFGKIKEVNEAFLAAAGAEKPSAIIGKKYEYNFDRKHDSDSENLWKALSEGQTWTGILEKKQLNGTPYWVKASVMPLYDPAGQLLSYLASEFEVSEFKLQEQTFTQTLQNYEIEDRELRQKAEELKSAQDEVKRTHLELSGQINALNYAAIVSETDFQGRIVSINENFLRITKFSREELIGENHRLLKSGHQTDDVFESLWKTVAKGQVWKGEFKNRAKDGSYFWISSVITPVMDENGQIVKYIGVAYNISAQKLQDEQLRAALQLSQAQEAELRINAEELQAAQMEMRKTQLELRGQIGALNNAGIVAETDLRGSITFVNDAFCEISKYVREELIKKNHRLLKSGHHPDEYFVEIWENISKGKVWTGRFKNRAGDGTFYWVISTITPVLGFDGKPVKYIGVSFDMTALVSQEELLKESLERSQSQEEALRRNEQKMLETQIELKGQVSALHNSAIVSETDPQGNIISVNDRFIIISRFLREELLGKNHRILKSDEHDDAFFKNMWQTLSEGRIWKGELKNRAKDGTEYWASATIAPVLDNEHRPVKYIGIQFDITELKYQEVKIREALSLAENRALEIRDKQQQMDSIFSNIPGIIYRRLPDALWSMILVSNHVEDILGIAASDFIHHRRSFIELIHPEDIFTVNGEIDTALQNRTSFNLTYRVFNSRRETIWIREEGRGVFNDFGNLIYVDGAMFDVTLQKKLEENLRRALEQSHTQQQQLQKNAEVMKEQQIMLAGQISALNNAGIVSESDAEGTITYVNDEAILKWGYSREELIGNNHRILKSKSHDEDFFRKMWLTISSGNVWKGVIKNRTKDENEYYSLLTITPVLGTDSKPLKYIAVAYDITREKRQANRIKVLFEETRNKETELRRYAEALEKIQEDILNSQAELTGHLQALNKSAIVTETDAEGKIFSINDFGLAHWGYGRAEVLGQTHQLVYSDEHPVEFYDGMWKQAAGGEIRQGKVCYRNKEGEPFWVHLTICPVSESGKQPKGFVWVAYPIDMPTAEHSSENGMPVSFYEHQITFLNNKITDLEEQLFRTAEKSSSNGSY